MKLLKDLLYTRNNVSLDIARSCSFLAALTFLGLSIYHVVLNRSFNPIDFGTGWGGVCIGSGGWIYARQKYEAEGGQA